MGCSRCRVDGIDSDAVFAQVQGRGLGQPLNTPLGGGVGCTVLKADDPRDGKRGPPSS